MGHEMHRFIAGEAADLAVRMIEDPIERFDQGRVGNIECGEAVVLQFPGKRIHRPPAAAQTVQEDDLSDGVLKACLMGSAVPWEWRDQHFRPVGQPHSVFGWHVVMFPSIGGIRQQFRKGAGDN